MTPLGPLGRWSVLPEKGHEKVVDMFGHTAHIYKDQLHVFGGVDKDGNFSNTHAVLDLVTHQWQKYVSTGSDNVPTSRNFHASCIREHSMFLFGGKSNGYHSDLYKLNLHTRKWKLMNQTGKAPLARYGHGASVYQGCVYVFGGYDQHGMDDDSLYEFNIATSVWKKVKVQRQPQNVSLGRFHHCQVVYKDSLLIFGGKGANYSDREVTNDILQYAFHTQTWQVLSDPKARELGYEPCARWGASMTLIGDDLYVFGGRDSVNHFEDFYKFNIPSCRWTKLPLEKGHPLARYFHYSVAYKNYLLILWGKNLFDREFNEITQWEMFDVPSDSMTTSLVSTSSMHKDSPRVRPRTSDGKKKKDRNSRVITTSTPLTVTTVTAENTPPDSEPEAYDIEVAIAEITQKIERSYSTLIERERTPEKKKSSLPTPEIHKGPKFEESSEKDSESSEYSDSDSDSMKEWEERIIKSSEMSNTAIAYDHVVFRRPETAEYSGSGSESYLRDYSSDESDDPEEIYMNKSVDSDSGSEEWRGRKGKKRRRQHQQRQHYHPYQQPQQPHSPQSKRPPSPSSSPSPLSRSSSLPLPVPDGAVTFKWRRGNLLGAGAFAQVYLCMQMDTGRLMAVKKVNLPTIPLTPTSPRTKTSNSISGSATLKAMKAVSQLEREIAVLNTLSHPNIVEYIGYKRTSKALNIFLEYQAGGSLASLLNMFGPFPENMICSFTRQIVSGLMYLHDNNIAHRDVKGANVLAGTDGTVKLADFGTSAKLRKIASLSTGFTTVTGTPYWMAPEVIRQGCEGGSRDRERSRGCDSYGCKADVWSLGATVIEMATCKPPWSDLPPVSALFKIGSSLNMPPIPSEFSPAGHEFLRKCFQRNVAKRASSHELHETEWLFPFQRNQPSPPSDKRLEDHEQDQKRTTPPTKSRHAQLQSQGHFPSSSDKRNIRPSLFQSQETPKVKQERRKIKSEDFSNSLIRGLASTSKENIAVPTLNPVNLNGSVNLTPVNEALAIIDPASIVNPNNKSKKLDKTLRSSLRRPHSQKLSSISFSSLGFSGKEGKEAKEEEKDKKGGKGRSGGRAEVEGEEPEEKGKRGPGGSREGEEGTTTTSTTEYSSITERGGSKGISNSRKRLENEVKSRSKERSKISAPPASPATLTTPITPKPRKYSSHREKGRDTGDADDMQFSILSYLRNEIQ